MSLENVRFCLKLYDWLFEYWDAKSSTSIGVVWKNERIVYSFV